jgi:peptidoglycan-N-acetylglucosamine deacetylase
LNGWKTDDRKYLEDISVAAQLIKSNLFRPPYGKIKNSQAKNIIDVLQTSNKKIIMWDVLSADFDSTISPEQCLRNVLENVSAGSIIVFHDSEKAFNNLKYALPKTLMSLKEEGFNFKKIEL